MPCDLVGCVGDGVDTSVGAYTFQDADLLFPSGLFGLEMARVYRSDRTEAGWLGAGWVTVYDTTLTDSAGEVTLTAPAGLAPRWQPEAPAGWAVSGDPKLSNTASGMELTWPTGEHWSFAATGSLMQMTSPFGQTVDIERTNGVPRVIRSSQGQSLTFTSLNGRVVNATATDGRSVSFEYSDRLLTRVTAPGGSTTYAYNADKLMTVRVGLDGTTTNGYDNGVVTGQVQMSGTRIALAYTGDRTTVTSPEALIYEHDSRGRLLKVASGDQPVTVRTYDTSGLLAQASDFVQPGQQLVRSLQRTYEKGRVTSETVNGTTTDIGYDGSGRVRTVSTAGEVTAFGYSDDSPLPTTVTSPAGGRTEVAYDHGFVMSVIDPNGTVTTTARDLVGNPTSRVTGDQEAWAYVYDAEGNITSTTSPSGSVWSATWGPRSKLLAEIDPLGRASVYRYDTAGRLVAEQLPGQPPRTLIYSASGQLAQETSSDGQVTRYEYDSTNALTAVIKPGERVWRTSTAADPSGGYRVTTTAPDGTYVVARLDSLGREVQRDSYEADSEVVERQQRTFTYNLEASTVTTRGTSRLESTTTYDALGHVTALADTIDGQPINDVRYTYENGLIIEAANGPDTATYTYDQAGVLAQVVAGTETWEAGYRAGQLTSTSHNGTTKTIAYDRDGRANSFTDPSGVTTQWTFDAAGRPTARSIGDATARFDWSVGDRLTNYHAPDGSTWAWTYDDAGRLVQADEPGGATTTYTYTLGAVTDIRSKGGGHDRHDTFEYDARGNVRVADTQAGKHQYTHDATGRVASIDGKESWTYDAAGRVLEVAVGSDAFQLAYDAQGRITKIADPNNSLQATWSATGLTNIDVTNHDPLSIGTDTQGRLASVQWDNKHAVDVTWSATGDSFSVAQRGKDSQQTYHLTDGLLSGFKDNSVDVSATYQPNGYLDTLSLAGNDTQTGQIKFDHLGRPATLVTANATSTIAYDTQGRVSAVLTSPGDKAPKQTLVTYENGERQIEGDKEIIDSLFTPDGALRTPLPSSLANPLSATSSNQDIAGSAAVAPTQLLVAPEPHPFDDVEQSISSATPHTSSPIGVKDLHRLAQQMVTAQVADLAPTVHLNASQSLLIPIIEPDNGNVVTYNPFVDAAPSGLTLGLLNKQAGGGDSLFQRAKDAVVDIVGGAYNLAADVAHFIISNPIARLVLTTGAFAVSIAACAPPAVAACVPLAAIAVTMIVGAGVQSIASSLPAAFRSCSGAQLAQCGLAVAETAIAIGAALTAVRVGASLVEIYQTRQALAAAVTAGEGIANASSQVGTAKSELLAALRFDRIVSREVDVIADGTLARIDLVNKTLFGRYRLIEVKNGSAARFTTNQQIVYPMLRSTGASMPNGILNNGSPQMIAATAIEVQHWGTRLHLSVP